MDNFMDKLAGRYSAADMIMANSQAEAAQMEGLQEQVEAYEAVLQEMRKLNYKNTELTEKMYSLVDESIEKVRTLQIEASENGANTELISREMSDAVTGALNEALNNMDSTVARTISESLAVALAQPAEDIKQSAMATMSVREAIEKVDDKVNSLSELIQRLQAQVENDLGTRIEGNGTESVDYGFVDRLEAEMTEKTESVSGKVDSVAEKLNTVSSEIKENADKIENATLEVMSNSEKLDAVVAAVTALSGTGESTSDNTEINGLISSKTDVVITAVNESASKTDAVIEAVNESASKTDAIITAVNESTSKADAVIEAVNASASKADAVIEAVNESASKTDAVITAVNENNEKINAVTESIRQSSDKVDDVTISVLSVSEKLDEISAGIAALAKPENTEIKEEAPNTETIEKIEKIEASVSSVAYKLDTVATTVAGTGENVEAIKESSELVLASFEDVVTRSKNLEEKIDMLKSDLAATIENSKTPAPVIEIPDNSEQFDELMVKSSEISEKISALTSIYEKLEALSLVIGALDTKMDPEFAMKQEATAAAVAGLADKLDNSQASICEMTGKLDGVAANSQSVVSSVSEKINENTAEISNKVNESSSELLSKINESSSELSNKINDSSAEIINKLDASGSAVAQISAEVDALNSSLAGISEVSGKVDTLYQYAQPVASIDERTANIDTYVRGLWDSVEALKAAMAGATGRESDELRAAVMEIVTNSQDISNDIRNLKAAQDDTKNSFKTSLDSAIYGLKQDNREIVEFMQRMNSNLMAKASDPDKERKEEEAREREEENKRLFEERIKANEDFMHKESVKVYRNVQAVLNEKTDRQTEDIETRIKQNEAKFSSVKVIAIVAACLSGADLILQVLKILGIF